MNILYLDCAMGAAGDMLMAALLELLPDRDAFLRDMNALGLPGIEVTAEPSVKCGVTGTHVHVFVHGEEEGHEHHDHEHEHGHEHHHTGLHEIEHRIGQLPVPEAVREDVRAVYRCFAFTFPWRRRRESRSFSALVWAAVWETTTEVQRLAFI